MRLTVVLDRRDGGLLRARVLQDGNYGKDLLAPHSVRDVAMAKTAVRMKLRAQFRDIEIVWQEAECAD